MFEQQHIQYSSFYQPLSEGTKSPRIVRKFINPAIYVERPITVMPPVRKTSPLSVTEESINSCTYRKQSSATLVSRSAVVSRKASESSGYGNSLHSLTSSENSTEACDTVRQREHESFEQIEAAKSLDKKFNNELKLSFGSMITSRTCNTEAIEKEENFKAWLARKNAEKLKRKEIEEKILKEQETQRQELIEKEKENFRKWLAEKKAQEEQKRKQKELEQKELELKEAEREKKKMESEVSYQLWLKRKKKSELERKIREKVHLLTVYEEKQQRMIENELAYQKWLESSKYKQKPIPLNKGFETLRTSASVSYINPIPWQVNLSDDQNLSSV